MRDAPIRPKPRGTLTEQLVEVWRRSASGHADSARELLVQVWSSGMDSLASEQESRVGLRLLEGLAPVTDDPDAWAALPDVLVIHRAGQVSGLCWSLEREEAEDLAREYDLSPVTMATVAKTDVLAYVTHKGEDEIIPRPGRVEIKTSMRDVV